MDWTTQQTHSQYLAIGRLRWLIFRNGFRRKSNNVAASIVSWVILTPIALLVLGGVCSLAFGAAWACVKSNHLPFLSLVYSGIFLLTLLANIQLGQPGTTFDPTQLIRFPLTARQYTWIRLFFGVLSPGNIGVVFMSLSAGAGILVMKPHLWVSALLASLTFALANVLFTRMLFSWVDRWLATRRAREIFTAFIFLIGMGFQYWNIHYNIGGHHRHHHHGSENEDAEDDAADAQMQARIVQMQKLGHYVHVLDIVPSGMAAEIITAADEHKPSLAAAYTLGSLAWSAVFFAIFSLRMRTEFRGENLSDVANAVSAPSTRARAHIAAPAVAPITATTPSNLVQPTSETVAALIQKELLYLRRNTGLLYGLVAPLVMVVIFATTRFARGTGQTWMFPAALAYALLGVLPVNFNSFGFDGIGVQTYFLTPVTMRDVLLAKNIFNTGLALVEIVVILGLVTYLAGFPSVLIVASVLLWALATLLIELTVGNYLSISSPKRIDPGRTAQKQARPLTALLSMGIMLAMAAIGWSLMLLVQNMPELAWILPLTMVVLAGVAGAVYWHNLKAMDIYAMRHRDALFEEMSRKA